MGFHAVRQQLAWYPDDVWRDVLACQWQRVSQEEAFVGRYGEVGDGLGSAIVAAALAATDWHTRENHLAVAYEIVATLHTKPASPSRLTLERVTTTPDRSACCTPGVSPRP